MSERLTPERVQIIEGQHLLATLHHHNMVENLGLVYRGSAHAEDVIRASVPYWSINESSQRYADSEYPVVCAEQSPLVAAFCAVAPSGHRAYFGKEGGGVHFRITHEAADAFYGAEGFVAVLADEDFKPFDGGVPTGWPWGAPIRLPEVRAALNQTPLLNVKISAVDFLDLLADNPDSNLEFCRQLGE